MYPSIGWIRSNRVSSERSQERLLELEQENLRLREELINFDMDPPPEKDNLSKGHELYEVHCSYELTFKDSSTKTRIEESMRMSWDGIFTAISSSLMQLSNNQTINRHLSNCIFRKVSHHICEQHGEMADKAGRSARSRGSDGTPAKGFPPILYRVRLRGFRES